ncbi:MAG TPA: HAMP domain-containing sensor histidine kinase [Sporichthyaceae bacterium]|nr:HAMP domain-containing sensor histidine kinase [Sporichthyaceae bacterium]
MTRRIIAGFLLVLSALLVMLVVPLGIVLSRQEDENFDAGVQATAHGLASLVEEHLGETSDQADQGPLTLKVGPADGVVVLDGNGNVVAQAGRTVPTNAIRTAGSGAAQRIPGYITVRTEVVSASGQGLGNLVLIRDDAALWGRLHRLWVVLAVAGVAALSVGTVVAAALARWIQRPLRALRAGAERIGEGRLDTRIGTVPGPPELRALASAFDDMAQRISGLLDAQQVMTVDVSHQLRTPLSALRLRLELLAQDVPMHLADDLRDALAEVARLNRLVDGLLAVARAEAVVAIREPVDLADVAAERVQAWAPVAAERGVSLRCAQAPARMLLTPGHLEQVLDNLIANALDALATGGSILVSLQREDVRVLLAVVDDGPGMSAEHRARAFERFSGEAKRPGRSGLGLAIVGRLVAADRGQIRLDETPGGGLTVLIDFRATPVSDGPSGPPVLRPA